MNAHHNIQHLFSWITVDQIRRYLLDRGWEPRAVENVDRLYFERTFAGGEQPATVWTWATIQHPRYRRQVPNLIFTLSVLEERPALDIANQIYASKEDAAASGGESPARNGAEPPASAAESAPVAAPPAAAWQRIILRLPQATTLSVTHDSLSDAVPVAAGDVVEIVHRSADGGLELEVAGDVVRIAAGASAGLRLAQGVGKPFVGPHWSAAQIVCAQTRRLEDLGDSKQAAQVLEEMAPVLARIDFELDVNARIDEQRQTQLLRQGAVLAAALSRRLPSDAASADILWRSCTAFLFPAGLRLELRSTSAVELLRTAAEDDEASPKRTLLWLKENSLSVV